MQAWLVNGYPGDGISLDDRGLAYGDGLFETIALRRALPRFFDRHMKRLSAGCRRLGIPAPLPEVVAAEIDSLRGAHDRGTIKIILTRGSGPRGYSWRDDIQPTRVIGFDPDTRAADEDAIGSVEIVHCRTVAGSNPAIAGLKTLNRLENVLARGELRGKVAREGLMFDSRDLAIGGTMTNLFIARDGQLFTPALKTSGVQGIMREVVIESARGFGIECHETDITREELGAAEELFLTNALIGLWPVSRCGEARYQPGPVTRRVSAALRERDVEECGR